MAYAGCVKMATAPMNTAATAPLTPSSDPLLGKFLTFNSDVEDDDPEGFRDLAQSWTLFAESERKGDPTKRGRFCLGEKLVLALCSSASISSTTGTVTFDGKGRHRSSVASKRRSQSCGAIVRRFRRPCSS